jgi:hypothetical protein
MQTVRETITKTVDIVFKRCFLQRKVGLVDWPSNYRRRSTKQPHSLQFLRLYKIQLFLIVFAEAQQIKDVDGSIKIEVELIATEAAGTYSVTSTTPLPSEEFPAALITV